MHICAWLCPCLSMCTCMLMYVETREQSHVPFSRLHATLLRHWFSLTWNSGRRLHRLHQQGPGILLFVPSQSWDYKHVPYSCCVFVGIWSLSACWLCISMAFIIAFLLTSSSGEEHNKVYNQFEIVHWKLNQFDLDIQPPLPFCASYQVFRRFLYGVWIVCYHSRFLCSASATVLCIHFLICFHDPWLPQKAD